MPRKPLNKLRLQIVDGILDIVGSSWERKSISKDEDGKEIIVSHRVARSVLRYPLAQNVSELTVERIAKNFL